MQEVDQLVSALQARIEAFQHGDRSQVFGREAIAEATQLWEAAQSASFSDRQLVPVVGTLAYFHWFRYLLLPDGQDRADLGMAKMLFELLSALDPGLVPDIMRQRLADAISAVAVAIIKRIMAGDDAADLGDAIDLLRQAIANTPSDDPRRSQYMSNLGVALNTRFNRVGQLADIDEAISLLTETVETERARGVESWQDLTNLGLALRSRYERAHEISDLNDAVQFLREAAESTQPSDLARAGLFQNLVITLLVRYQELSDMADVDEAIRAGKEAVAASPSDDPDRRHRTFNLANALKARFDRTGHPADLDEAVRLLREAAETTPVEEPDRAEKLNNLLHALSDRFERSGAIDDLEEELRVARLIVEITPVDDPERTDRLSNFRVALLSPLRRIGELAALNYDDHERDLALAYYHEASEMLRSIGDELAAEEIAQKIKALEAVTFTAFYPQRSVPRRKYGVVVYAHLPELRNDVKVDAQKFSMELGAIPTPRHSEASVRLERDTPITVVPECPGALFDPPELTKRWDGSWTRFLFDFKLNQASVSQVVLVRISVQVAGIEIASINNCAIEVTELQQGDEDVNPLAHAKWANQTSTLYQKIFVSYSHRDQEITYRYKLAQIALGNEVFVDVDDLRAGENWKAGLARAIDAADVFQLFWSRNSANSEYCQYEWSYALKFRCPDGKCEGFVRPVYWEKPMPDRPPELSDVNFKYVPFTELSTE